MSINKQKRVVILSNLNSKPTSNSGKPPTVYGYTIKDISILLDVTEGHIRNLISQHKLDPTSLLSIFKLMIN